MPSKKRFYSRRTGSTYLEGLHRSMPDDVVEISEERYLSSIATQGKGKVRSHDEHGLPILVDPPPMSIPSLADTRRRQIDSDRDQAFAVGLPYDIAGTPDVVQTRPQDQINLLGLSSKAQRLLADGDTETLIPFRGLSNVSYGLTAQQMDDLTMAALAHIEGIYQQSWDRKDAIDAALEDETLTDDEKRSAIDAVTW